MAVATPPPDSLSGLGTALTVLFGLMALLGLVDTFVHLQLRGRWLDLTEGGRFTGTLADLNDVGELEVVPTSYASSSSSG